jgi:hypothetical protein
MENINIKGAGLLLENCDDAIIDGVTLRGTTNNLANAVSYRITNGETYRGLRIANIFAPGTTEPGIVLESVGKRKGLLTDYIITGNLTTVDDRLKGERSIVTNNLP